MLVVLCIYVFVCICIYLYACRRSENLNRKPFDKSNSCREALHTIDKSRQHLSFDMHAKVDSRSTQLASILHLSFRNLFCRGCRFAAEHFIIVSPSCLMAALVACWSLQPFNTRLWHDGRSDFFSHAPKYLRLQAQKYDSSSVHFRSQTQHLWI